MLHQIDVVSGDEKRKVFTMIWIKKRIICLLVVALLIVAESSAFAIECENIEETSYELEFILPFRHVRD